MMTFKKKRDYVKRIDLEKPVKVAVLYIASVTTDFGELDDLTNLFLNRNQEVIDKFRMMQATAF